MAQPSRNAARLLFAEQVPGQPQLTGWVACHRCGRPFTLCWGPNGEPLALHKEPKCSAFDAIKTTDDAVRFSKACRSKVGDFRENG